MPRLSLIRLVSHFLITMTIFKPHPGACIHGHKLSGGHEQSVGRHLVASHTCALSADSDLDVCRR